MGALASYDGEFRLTRLKTVRLDSSVGPKPVEDVERITIDLHPDEAGG